MGIINIGFIVIELDKFNSKGQTKMMAIYAPNEEDAAKNYRSIIPNACGELLIIPSEKVAIIKSIPKSYMTIDLYDNMSIPIGTLYGIEEHRREKSSDIIIFKSDVKTVFKLSNGFFKIR